MLCSYLSALIKWARTDALLNRIGTDQLSHIEGRDAILWGFVPGYVGRNVKRVFQALAVDETLDVFKPTRMVPDPHKDPSYPTNARAEIKEVWFSGAFRFFVRRRERNLNSFSKDAMMTLVGLWRNPSALWSGCWCVACTASFFVIFELISIGFRRQRKLGGIIGVDDYWRNYYLNLERSNDYAITRFVKEVAAYL